ncbi:MAG TPA: hypothetical protein VMV49_14480 [Candidatus Deferrimicrobium sp.]|nr:hypothetical protein [Candidatus Deferrimicrobium sp.]
MKIVYHGKPVMRVGLRENYEISNAYYRCGRLLCPGAHDPLIRAPNPHCADFDEYDYEVKAKVCELRWTQRLTHEEIVTEMDRLYGIKINHSVIEITLKMYELGCAEKYRLDYFRRIHARGGVLLQVDAMKPLKGSNALYAAHDYYTGLSLSSKHLPREGQTEIENFLKKLEIYLTGLGIAILGVISDAHVAQSKAIEAVFGPDIPHSLCHYHFFNLILKKPKELDSHLLTTLRKNLRGAYYIQKYRKNLKGNSSVTEEIPFIEHLLHDLYTLSNWHPRKKDPAFSGLTYSQRIQEITLALGEYVLDLDRHLVVLETQDERQIRKLTLKLQELLEPIQEDVIELQRIKAHLQELSEILEDTEETAEEGSDRLRKFTVSLNSRSKSKSCGPIEREFITQLDNFVKTKGTKLFNYRLIPDAPRTNNGQELAFKQLKHLLRRIIGYNAANNYLLAHGERMLFVNPKESFQRIVEILKEMDWTTDRKRIQVERTKRNATIHIMHDSLRWMNELNVLGEKWALLKKQLPIRK